LRKALGVIARQQGLADVARVGRYSVAAGAARGYERDVAAARAQPDEASFAAAWAAAGS
jgi:hypothetical protein